MTMLATLTSEFARESATTRRHLERLPTAKFAWRPHAKSFTAGELAAHLIECIGFAEPILSAEELDMNPATDRPYEATTAAGLLEAFDGKVRAGMSAMAGATEETLAAPWRFTIIGRVRTGIVRPDRRREGLSLTSWRGWRRRAAALLPGA